MKTRSAVTTLLLLFTCISAADSAAQVKMSEKAKNSGINFTTDFESGSLDSVELKKAATLSSQMQQPVGIFEFDVYSRLDPANPADPKLAPSGRWFYFKMERVKGKQITLNFHNTDPKRPYYSYDGENFTRFSPEEASEYGKITKRFEQDTVYIAYFPPYTVSYLNSRIEEWSKRGCVKVESIGKSEHGRQMPLLTVTEPNPNLPDRKKHVVYIHGRIHTSEAPASWHLDKLIDLITGSSDYAGDLRKEIIFYILPFTNPDGVAEGMSRSNGEGINLEVNWANADSVTAQETRNIRAFLESITKKGKGIDIALNMHSQSSDFVTYWIHTAESTSDEYYKNLMLFANLTINGNPHFFKKDLSFSAVAPRYVEGWLWERCNGKALATTFETPYTFYNRNKEGEWVTIENLQEMAINNLYAIGDYLQIKSPERIVTGSPRKKGGFAKADDFGHFYFGKNYLVAKREGAKALFKIKELPAGRYGVYSWKVGKNERISGNGENEWQRIDSIEQKQEGSFKYLYRAASAGEKLDNLLFIKEQ